MRFGTMLSFVRQYLHKSRIGEISAPDVYRNLNKRSFLLLDANLRGQWLRGHLPGAKYVGMMENVERGVLPDDRNMPLVFYCESSL